MKPVQLAPNLIDHFYRGGAKIAALRGYRAAGERPARGVDRGHRRRRG